MFFISKRNYDQLLQHAHTFDGTLIASISLRLTDQLGSNFPFAFLLIAIKKLFKMSQYLQRCFEKDNMTTSSFYTCWLRNNWP